MHYICIVYYKCIYKCMYVCLNTEQYTLALQYFNEYKNI
jgi:hypothetical protein